MSLFHLFVGVGEVSLNLRYSQSLKDKRQILNSVMQRLKNMGFSVIQHGKLDNPKQAMVGFTLVGGGYSVVEKSMEEAKGIFHEDCEVLDWNTDIFDYSLS